jgi:hypothetical protein
VPVCATPEDVGQISAIDSSALAEHDLPDPLVMQVTRSVLTCRNNRRIAKSVTRLAEVGHRYHEITLVEYESLRHRTDIVFGSGFLKAAPYLEIPRRDKNVARRFVAEVLAYKGEPMPNVDEIAEARDRPITQRNPASVGWR